MEEAVPGGTESSSLPASGRNDVLHVPKAVFIEDVAAFLEGVI